MDTRTTTEAKGNSQVLNNAPLPMDQKARSEMDQGGMDTSAMGKSETDTGGTDTGAMDKGGTDKSSTDQAQAKTGDDGKSGAAMDADAKVDTDAKADTDATATKDGEPHTREQLRKRVEARVGELEAELAKLSDPNTNTERAMGLKTELQVAKDAIGGGWDHVGEMEALRLSKWLQSTQPLVAKGQGDTDNGPEAMMGPNNIGDGSVKTTEKYGVTTNALGEEVPPTYPT
jgi:hypothetical protein